ncbi:type I-B CRISPR-associated protein Cas7/Csh2 [Sulfurihydrogenibium subterraneum]|uniref:type I-B CRISPR-associated protein Cas7/Csh2 n=1 Tax=Sulfurihydrogenibium subterraneum TaxID=171121 RepID=UPI00048DB95C|nr:type I-B CRISPR-associated protein Cas7/Csh2 [Sulfurihydrogenibium subterraneum]
MGETIKNRREYLFLYDVSFGNPNGDPNDDNKPRIDEETGRNIVTDVRLKRTVRDYLYNFKNLEIFIREGLENGNLQDAKARAKNFENNPVRILNECIDVRLFGATIPVETGKSKDNSVTFTGPVQFNMGQSLHRVKLEYIKGTGAFASDKGKSGKTFREEWILPYSFIAFHGVANENAAKHTNLKDEDLELLKEALWYGTKNLITRSKTEHSPRLLIEIIYKENLYYHIGELHRYIKIESDKQDEEIRSTDDFILNIDKLLEVIEENKDKIEKVLFKVDRNLKLNRELKLDFVKFEEINL